MTDDRKVVDLNLRRAQRRKAPGEESRDPVVRAAERLTALYGELATEMNTVDLFAAISLADRAAMMMLNHAVGEESARALAQEGLQKPMTYAMNEPTHYRGPTVFDQNKEDE